MKYYSTNKQSALVDFKDAAIKGQAPDKGLYFPETIPQVDKDKEFNEIVQDVNTRIATHLQSSLALMKLSC